MCFIGGVQAAPAPKKPEFADAPPVVTGKQTGVDDPKDTQKATDKLRMNRIEKEIKAGTYNDPNLGRTEELLTKSKSGGKYTMKKDSTGRLRKMKTSTYRKSLRSKARSKSKSKSK